MGCVGCARLARVCVWRRLGAVRARACVFFMKTLQKAWKSRKWELRTRVPVVRTRVPNFGHIYRHAIETPEGGRLDLIFSKFYLLKSLGPESWSRGRPGSSSFFRTLPVQHHRKQNTKQNPSSAACCCSRVRRSIPHINHPTKEPAPPASILISVPVGLWVFMLPQKNKKTRKPRSRNGRR